MNVFQQYGVWRVSSRFHAYPTVQSESGQIRELVVTEI